MKNRVLVAEPHLCSRAAQVLLRRRLRREQLAEWLEFRSAYLARARTAAGELVCHYCGKRGLLEEVGEHPARALLSMLATVDHVRPRARGGAEYDEANLVVACHTCNVRKGDRYEELGGC